MRRFVLLSLLTLGSLAAQGMILTNRLPPDLVTYLEITDAQQGQIVQANQAFQNFSIQKQRRSAQVQAEISIETRKPDLDPMALGLRYRELEAIRRETAEEQARTVQTVQNILTAAQKQKLSTLQEALRLQSTACIAVAWSLMTQPQLIPANRISIYDPATVSSLTSVLLPNLVPTCGVPTSLVRTGDFTFMPMVP